MDNITEFFASFLGLVADFLGSEPIIYLFAIACLIYLIKVLRTVMS